MNTQTDARHDAVAGPVERPVRPRFCRECQHCGKEPYDRNTTKRVCAAAPSRREAHIEARGKTPDAYWTVPDVWVYVNSGFADRCKWFAAA